MNYIGYELEFTTAIHVGKKRLEDAEKTFFADTIFSALCHEAIMQGGNSLLDTFVDKAKKGSLMITDTFPYCCRGKKKCYYVPKPIMKVVSEEKGDSEIKKNIKKLEYIPFEALDDYVNGKLDAKAEVDIFKEIGKSEIRTMASTGEEDTLPFSVGTFSFSVGWGLYIIVGYESKEDAELAESLLLGLEYTGIGGKRNAGLGKFQMKTAKLPTRMIEQLHTEQCSNSRYMALSLAMADKANLPDIMEDASYGIIRRGGFISSETFSDRALKKKDSFLFKAGSVFTKTFKGVIEDVSTDGNHSVYRYGKPIFLEVK